MEKKAIYYEKIIIIKEIKNSATTGSYFVQLIVETAHSCWGAYVLAFRLNVSLKHGNGFLGYTVASGFGQSKYHKDY